jgi:predicted  nucleic acid-binding Zn-ribbon protein
LISKNLSELLVLCGASLAMEVWSKVKVGFEKQLEAWAQYKPSQEAEDQFNLELQHFVTKNGRAPSKEEKGEVKDNTFAEFECCIEEEMAKLVLEIDGDTTALEEASAELTRVQNVGEKLKRKIYSKQRDLTNAETELEQSCDPLNFDVDADISFEQGMNNYNLQQDVEIIEQRIAKYAKEETDLLMEEMLLGESVVDLTKRLVNQKERLASEQERLLKLKGWHKCATYHVSQNRIHGAMAEAFIRCIFPGFMQFSIPVDVDVLSERIIDVFQHGDVAHEVKTGKWRKEYEIQLTKDDALKKQGAVSKLMWHFVAFNSHEQLKQSDFTVVAEKLFQGSGIEFYSWILGDMNSKKHLFTL